MTEPILNPPAAIHHTTTRMACQIALWAIIGLKAIWLVMALTFVGPQWQVLLFGFALLILVAATWSFGAGNRALAISLAWLGVLVAIAVGYFGGVEPGPLTDRIHEQFRSHIADFVFLAIAHLDFWAFGTVAPEPVA